MRVIVAIIGGTSLAVGVVCGLGGLTIIGAMSGCELAAFFDLTQEHCRSTVAFNNKPLDELLFPLFGAAIFFCLIGGGLLVGSAPKTAAAREE